MSAQSNRENIKGSSVVNLTLSIEVNEDMSHSDSILAGILLIRKYDPSACFEGAEHDTIWFGECKPEEMFESELRWMKDWGWRQDGGYWQHFV